MDFGLEQRAEGLVQMTWDRSDDIFPNVWYSLNIRRGALFTAPKFGLDLSDIRKVTDSKIALIKKRLQTALNWLLETGRAIAIKVTVERNNLVYNRVDVAVEVIQADSMPLIISSFITVGV